MFLQPLKYYKYQFENLIEMIKIYYPTNRPMCQTPLPYLHPFPSY